MTRIVLLLLAILLPAAALRAENPFGLMLAPEPDLSLTVARAAGLGVAWYRPANVILEHWRAGAPCPNCRVLARSGLQLALTVRNGGPVSSPPADDAQFRDRLDALLDQWRPALLVVEDEEDRPQRYAADGDAAGAYGRQLAVACSAAHARHAACANGGLSFAAATTLTWLALLRDGKPDLACDYARRAPLADAEEACRSRGEGQAERRRAQFERAVALVPVYRASAIDAVNFHWHGGDAVALAQTIDALARLTGKPVTCNEIVLPDNLAGHVRPLMRAAMAGHLLTAIWISIDGGDSRSLFDPSGRLRPTGEEFAHQMSGRK